jgi:hypothetical protein
VRNDQARRLSRAQDFVNGVVHLRTGVLNQHHVLMSSIAERLTRCSLAASKELVASSSARIAGLPRSARAIASLWRCPPDSDILPTERKSPISYSVYLHRIAKAYALSVSKPFGIPHTYSQFASRAARSMSSLVAFGCPYAMFSAIVPVNITGSCGTTPMIPRHAEGSKSRISESIVQRHQDARRGRKYAPRPSNVTFPFTGS